MYHTGTRFQRPHTHHVGYGLHATQGIGYQGIGAEDSQYLANLCRRIASHDAEAIGTVRALTARAKAGDVRAKAALVNILNCARSMNLAVGAGGTYIGFHPMGVVMPIVKFALSPLSWALWGAGKVLNLGASALSTGSHAAGTLAAKTGHAIATPVAQLGTRMQSPASILPVLPHVP